MPHAPRSSTRVVLALLLTWLAVATTAPAPASADTRPPPSSGCLERLATPSVAADGAYGMALDPVTHELYVVVDGHGKVDVISPTTNAVIDTIPLPASSADQAVVDHANDTLYVSSFSSDAVWAIDISTEAVVKTIPVSEPQQLALNGTTHRLYVAGQTTEVTIVDTTTNTKVGVLAAGGKSLGVAVDRAGDRIFVGDYTNHTLDVFGGDKVLDHSWPLPGQTPVTVRYDGTTGNVWVTLRTTGKVVEIDPDTGATGTTLNIPGAQGLDIDADLHQGYVAGDSGTTLTVFDLIDGSVIDVFPIGTAPLVVEAATNPLRIYVADLELGTVDIYGPGDGIFTDVPGSHPFCFDISWLANEGVTTGFPDGTFRPTSPVTRQSMAAFLWRTAGMPAIPKPPAPTFSDVPDDHPFYAEIEWLAAEGIADGYPDGTFRPGAPVSRQAMAAFLYRFQGSPLFFPPGTPTFPDVPTSHPFRKEIEWLAARDITGGYADGTFRPAISVARQAMAAFLHRFDRL